MQLFIQNDNAIVAGICHIHPVTIYEHIFRQIKVIGACLFPVHTAYRLIYLLIRYCSGIAVVSIAVIGIDRGG
ncbi:hypothetical protein SDC9_158749 [bioreactor metagenome]|uniref:Uncharacterized protein n=1 Tax=bioreactor metagenome TaxID=1076179 RepID=A0A645FAP7_9ZZZZ